MFARRLILLSVTMAVVAGAFAAEPQAVVSESVAPGLSASSGTEQSVVSTTAPTLRTKVRTVALTWLNRSGQLATTKFGITLDAGVPQAATEKPLVIVVHGFNSTPQRNRALLTTLREAGYPCGTFRYPNDQPIADSATLLSQELRLVAQEYPQRKVALVTHSMGGLVAREVIENQAFDPGNIARLIMVAPPTHGTSCAYIKCSGDIWEHGLCGDHHGVLDCIYACMEDGWGEARDDLQPDSAFLQRLNGRQRNANVRYTVFLGTGTPFTPEHLEHARQLLHKGAESNSLVAVVQPALERAIDDFTDSAQEGDGVVSVARGRLDAVPDTVLLEFNHWNVIGEPQDKAVAVLHREILNRLDARHDGSVAKAAE